MEFWLNLMFGSSAAIASMIGIFITLGIMTYFVYFFISHVKNADPLTGEEKK